MDELQKRGGKLIYDPELIAYRRPRPTLGAFVKMLMNYGRGRAEQFRLHPTIGSAPNFVPPLFCVFLVALPLLPPVALCLLLFYFLIVGIHSISSVRVSRITWFPHMAGLIFISHVFYGLGFWKGLFTKHSQVSKMNSAELELQIVSS
jgi:hypothetical protein